MENFDVIIVGAGLSGIGAAKHLIDNCSKKSFAILEGRAAVGGTWDLFRYPGIRSDSDMYTLGYNFKPWKDAKAIADGPSIRRYVNEAADENGIREHIRFQHLVKSASWSTNTAQWIVEAEKADTGETVQYSCNFLSMCGGYYSYEKGYTPEFKEIENFEGQVVHPQFWPEDLKYEGKKVVVIGSGATAMTLVPALAKGGAEVTMLQRSPTYVVSLPAEDKIANRLRKFLPGKLAYALTRWKNVRLSKYFYNRARTQPAAVKAYLINMVKQQLPNIDVDKHFTPSYNPWDQRMCLIPDADLFKSLRSGKAGVVTDHIDHFTKSGIQLKSGQELEADIIVTATGLQLNVLSDVKFTVDGKDITVSEHFSYKGMMLSDVPNMVQTFGYINASWTLRADLTSEYVCRLINRMDKLGMRQVSAPLREADKGMQARKYIEDFTPGYMMRTAHLMPRQGDKEPWLNTQNYTQDKKMIRRAPLEDGVLKFENPHSATPKTSAA